MTMILKSPKGMLSLLESQHDMQDHDQWFHESVFRGTNFGSSKAIVDISKLMKK